MASGHRAHIQIGYCRNGKRCWQQQDKQTMAKTRTNGLQAPPPANLASDRRANKSTIGMVFQMKAFDSKYEIAICPSVVPSADIKL